MPIQLSMVERLVLANQDRVLCNVDPDSCRYFQWEQRIEILENGFEGLYPEIFREISSRCVSEEECRFVADILTLATWMAEFNDKGLNVEEFINLGFDGNNESELLNYAEFVYRGTAHSYPGIASIVNCHAPMRERYAAMLREWEVMGKRGIHTQAEAARIIKAGALGL
jgi:uncharacterized protein YfbU (UPF0304 family)